MDMALCATTFWLRGAMALWGPRALGSAFKQDLHPPSPKTVAPRTAPGDLGRCLLGEKRNIKIEQ
eukprot:8699066-Pyramimonas_sp.AAC.1